MEQRGKDLACRCGYLLEFSDGCFLDVKDGRKKGSDLIEHYTEEYYDSSLYDFTDYRIGKILSLAEPRAGRRILDLGCGPGEVSIRCARLGAEVFGIDVSKDALRLSASRARRAGVEISLFEFDGEGVPFRDSSFDSVVLADVVEHVEDETLDRLLAECSRLLVPGGRLVIHTSPTRWSVALTRAVKLLSMGHVDFKKLLTEPDYEFLHIRYHSERSLRSFLEGKSLYPLSWGEYRYLADTPLPGLLRKLGLERHFSDQLWCVAFKGQRPPRPLRSKEPFLSLLEPCSEVDLGKCDELRIGRGFYGPEAGCFRWTGKEAMLFITVPEGTHKLKVEACTSNPHVEKAPVKASFYLNGSLVGTIILVDRELRRYDLNLLGELKPGTAELRIDVDKTFCPRDEGMGEDGRDLGVAVYRVNAL